MKARYLATSMLVLALAVGCSKSNHQTNETQSPAETQTDVQLPLAETQPKTQMDNLFTIWQAGTENPLLKLVPDDAAAVIATQRSQDISNKGLYDNLTFLKEIFYWIKNQYIVPEELITDYKGKAPEWGLDPQGKLDAVLYVHDGYGVIHVTVADPEKALERADRWIRNTGKNENVWKNPSWCFMDECKDALVTEFSETHDWHVYRFVMDGRPKPVVHALHLAGNILSFVVFDEGQSLPEHVLEAAKKPLAMNWTEKNSVLAARVDYARLIQVLFKHPYWAEKIDEEFLSHLSKEDEEKMKAISQAESIFSPADKYSYNDFREQCKKEAPLHCTKVPYCTCQEAEGVDCKECYKSENCVWLHACEQCVYSRKCVADRLGKKWLPPREWLKRLEKPSISDDICIEEGKSVFRDISYSTLDWAVSDDGAFNLNFSTHLSPEMQNNLKSLLTEHAEWEERQDHLHGYIAFNLKNAEIYLETQLNSITESSKKCPQLRRIFDDIYDINSRIKSLLEIKDDDEWSSFINDSISVSGSFTVTEFKDYFDNPQFMTYLISAPWLIQFINSLTKMDENIKSMQIGEDGKSLIFGTESYQIDKKNFSLKKSPDTFIDITFCRGMAEKILEESYRGEFNTQQNYHLKAYIKDDSFILNLEGTAIQ